MIGITLNLQITLGSTAILTVVSLPIHKHSISFYIFRSSICIYGIGSCNYEGQDLQSAIWKPRRADSIVQAEYEGMRTRIADGIISTLGLSPKAREECFSSLKTVRQKEKLLSYSGFCPIHDFIWLDEAHTHANYCTTLLSLLVQMIFSSRNTLTDALRSNV